MSNKESSDKPIHATCPVCNKPSLSVYGIGNGTRSYLCSNLCDEARIEAELQSMADGDEVKRGYEFVSIGELMSEVHDLDWIVRDWVPAEGMSLLFGDSEAGKTFVALDWSLHVATGKPWHGKEVEQGNVFYVVGEGRSGLKWRIAAWCQWYGVKPENVPMHVSKVSAQLYDEIGAAEVASAINGTSNAPGLIVVDTLARNFGAGDENSTKDMNKFVDHLDAYFCKPMGAMLMVVHHPGHGDKGRARGAYSLHCALDAEYQVTREDDTVRLECTKMKNEEHPEPMAFKTKRVEIDGEVDKYGVPRSSLIFEQTEYKAPSRSRGLGKTQARALDVLKEMHTERRINLAEQDRNPNEAKVELLEWRAQLEIEEMSGKPLLGQYPSKRWPKIRDSLVAKKVISINGCHAYVDF